MAKRPGRATDQQHEPIQRSVELPQRIRPIQGTYVAVLGTAVVTARPLSLERYRGNPSCVRPNSRSPNRLCGSASTSEDSAGYSRLLIESNGMASAAYRFARAQCSVKTGEPSALGGPAGGRGVTRRACWAGTVTLPIQSLLPGAVEASAAQSPSRRSSERASERARSSCAVRTTARPVVDAPCRSRGRTQAAPVSKILRLRIRAAGTPSSSSAATTSLTIARRPHT